MRTGLLVLMVLSMAPRVEAAGAVWRVVDGGHELFLAGTVHLLRPDDLPLPASFDRAYRQADSLVFETDLDGLLTPEARSEMARRMRYGEGDSLPAHLTTGTWQALLQFSEARGISASRLERLRPGGLFLTLQTLEMTRLGATEDGVDVQLYRRALQDGKPVTGLEPLETHLNYLFGMGLDDPDRFVRRILDEVERSGETLDGLIAAWRQGDEATLYGLLGASLEQDSPDLYRRLVLERNRRWIPDILRLLASPSRELVLVGAAHLVGPGGLLAELRARGYRVEAVDG